ncbi:TIGR03118 family protein [Streptomyces sp. TS71-3]|uniref:TIGR03118 family protein n=1 Tax=Streptomyces sp. TS71-3 TaxID=2733862 RepID=UPI001B158B8A|nr:TIGR03118 family protein [Streptomyces sp. TS71-3]GHJ41120.1 hypothetical protein Sm713_67290 [Streptomyces sp. TS71-3]
MKDIRASRALAISVAAAAGLALAASTGAFASTAQHPATDHRTGYSGNGRGHTAHQGSTFEEVDLVSDIPGKAKLTDPDLKNPWGIAMTSASALWTSNQGTNSSTLYSLPAGTDTVAKSDKVRVTMADSVPGPAGQVAYEGTGFVLHNGDKTGSARFMFSTLDGHIEAWSPGVDPNIGQTEDVATVAGAAFTGLAVASTAQGDQLYATDFASGAIDVFDSRFKPVKLAPWQFRDAHLPKGYKAFNAQAIGNNVYVTYDIPNPDTGLEGTEAGNGIVDEYDASGHFLARVASGKDMSAPWGLAIAPKSWGDKAGDLLIGNFGDGTINILPKHGHHFDNHHATKLRLTSGKPFSQPGLWGLLPGTETTGGTDAVWFASGINGEKDGLLGVIRP